MYVNVYVQMCIHVCTCLYAYVYVGKFAYL